MTLTFLQRDRKSRAFDTNCALIDDAKGNLHAVLQHIAPSGPNPTRPASSIVAQPLLEDLTAFSGQRRQVVFCNNRTALLYHYEEPRIIRRPGNGFYLLTCSWGGQYFEDSVNFYTAGHQILYELDEQFNIQKERHPVYRCNGAHHFSNLKDERNWLPLLYDGQLFMICHLAPHTAFREIDEYDTEEYKTPGISSWEYGTPNGGSSPYPFDDNTSIVFFHSYLTKGSVRTYYVGVYLLENKPPFRIVRNSQKPLAIGDLQQTADNEFKTQIAYFVSPSAPSAHKPQHAVLFPCGAVRRDKRWLVGVGINNITAGILTFSDTEVEASL